MLNELTKTLRAKYSTNQTEVYPWAVSINGGVSKRFKTETAARKYFDDLHSQFKLSQLKIKRTD